MRSFSSTTLSSSEVQPSGSYPRATCVRSPARVSSPDVSIFLDVSVSRAGSSSSVSSTLLALHVLRCSVELPRCATRSSRRGQHQQVILLMHSILEVSPSSEFHHHRPLRQVRSSTNPAASSREVSGSFSTYQWVESTCASLPHSLRSVFRVSHPLDGFLLAHLPGLVSCPCAPGVPSLQSFFHETVAAGPLDPTAAFLPFTAGAFAASRCPEFSADPSLLDHPVCTEHRLSFKALLHGSCPVRLSQAVRPARRPWLSWVSAPLQGPPSRPAQRVLPPPLLPRAWLARFTTNTAKAVFACDRGRRLLGVFTRPKSIASSCRRDTPSWGPSTSSSYSGRCERCSGPGALFRLGRLGPSRDSARTLFGQSRRVIGPRAPYRNRSRGS